MRQKIINEVRQSFSRGEASVALEHLNSISRDDVMAKSQNNLDKTWLAIIKLSDGDLRELVRLTECAKKDFRDVIYWASSKEKEGKE